MMSQGRKRRRLICCLADNNETAKKLHALDSSDSTENPAENSADIISQISASVCDSSSSQCTNDDDCWISSSGSSSERLGVNMLTLQSFESAGCSDVYEISDSNTDDATNDASCSGSPIISTEHLLTSSSAIPLDRKQLLFLYDCETTGLSHYDEHVIEIASVVIVPDNLSFTKTKFTSLCHTSRRIHPKTISIHGISPEMLVGQPPFSTVFRDLLEWIKQCTVEACSSNKLDVYYPVLVAHNGFAFDYPFLMTEIKRHNLEESFDTAELWFADTLYDVRRLVKAADPIFANWSQVEKRRLGMESLFHKYFPKKVYQGHRAMTDVQNMKQIFMTTMLRPILTNLTVRTKEEIWKNSSEKWSNRRISQPYTNAN